MNSNTSKTIENLLKKVCTEIEKYKKFSSEDEWFFNMVQSHAQLYNVDLEYTEAYDKSVELLTAIRNTLLNLQELSTKYKYYFFDCSFETYKNTLHSRKENYKLQYSESLDLDFYKLELKRLKSPNTNRKLLLHNVTVDYSGFCANLKNFEYALVRKLDYITALLESQSKNSTVPSIFIDKDSYNLFLYLIDNLNINESNISERGVQAKFMGIWEVDKEDRNIFKSALYLKDFIEYLNAKYSTDYNSKSVSNGSNFHSDIKNFINSYKNR